MPEIEFFKRANGHTLCHEFIRETIKDKKVQILIDDKLERLKIHGFKLDGDFFGHIESKLFEFRLRTFRGYVRLFFIDGGSKFIFLDGVLKKSDRVPYDIEHAKNLMTEYYKQNK